MESIRIDLKNSIVVGSVIENTKTAEAQDLYLFHVCEYSQSEYEYKYKYQVLQLWRLVTTS